MKLHLHRLAQPTSTAYTEHTLLAVAGLQYTADLGATGSLTPLPGLQLAIKPTATTSRRP